MHPQTTFQDQLQELEQRLNAMDELQLAELYARHRKALAGYSAEWALIAQGAAETAGRDAAIEKLKGRAAYLEERWRRLQEQRKKQTVNLMDDVRKLMGAAAKLGIEVNIEAAAEMDLQPIQNGLEEALEPPVVRRMARAHDEVLEQLLLEVAA